MQAHKNLLLKNIYILFVFKAYCNTLHYLLYGTVAKVEHLWVAINANISLIVKLKLENNWKKRSFIEIVDKKSHPIRRGKLYVLGFGQNARETISLFKRVRS